MSSNFPTSKDDAVSLPNPAATNKQNSPSHSFIHSNANDAIKAIESKVGIGDTMPAVNKVLLGTGAGTSAWQQLTSAELRGVLSDETGTGEAVFSTTPTITTPKIDTINEETSASGVTIDGLNIKDGVLNTNDCVVNSNLAANAVGTSEIADASVTSEKLKATIACRAYRNSALTIDSGAIRKIDLNATTFNYGNDFDTANYRFVAPVTGLYQVNAAFQVDNIDALGQQVLVHIYVNGASYATSKDYAVAANNDPAANISTLAYVEAGQYIELYGQHTSATTTESVAIDVTQTFLTVLFCGTV